MGRYYCCMPECHNFSGKLDISGNIITLHKLPTKQTIRAISPKIWKPTAYTRVCSEHFLDGVGPNSVQLNRIPTENLAQRPKTVATKSRRVLFQCHINKSTENPENSYKSFPSSSDTSDLQPLEQLEVFHTYPVKAVGDTQSAETTQRCESSALIKPETCDDGFGTCKPEITIEDIQHSEEKIQFYTGLPNYLNYSHI
ncbi:hypothetical protein MAR_032512 [Mya arenaria]|uniref:THAP-type domain-containing protein n=1 Tax=Mya arenaria TaxID=6604 RepID=A0ABY7FB55_MYAAR|nr:hypothetical protein MAR_032512 [Mya arenaria]